MKLITISAALALLLPGAAFGAPSAPDGTAIFHQNCAPCHGKDGKAKTPAARKLGVKDLTKSTISDPEIARQIRGGRKGSDGKIQMPAFGGKLSTEQIQTLITFVKALRR